MKPKISVILPCYNVESYLKQCLDSIINQTLKDIEIICIDDGSTDGTLAILEEYANKDTRIKIIQQENCGPGAARNAGLDIAIGEYVSMLDSDDFFKLNMLELMYNIAEKRNTDILICRANRYKENDGTFENIDWTINKKLLPKKLIFNYKDMPKHIIGFCLGWAWDKFYKKDFIDKYNIRYAKLKNSEDLTFVFLSLVLASRISIINNILISHRQRNNSVEMSRDNNPQDFIIAAQKLREDLINYNLYEKVEQSFLNWFIPFAFWYVDTLNNENRNVVRKKLENEVFNDFNVYNKPQKYFYNKSIYCRINKKDYINLKFIEQIFSIKNSGNKTHKIITILGIQIRIKRKSS